MGLILRIAVNALGLAAAVWLLDGITLTGDTTNDRVLVLLGVAVIFGLVNAILRPILRLLSLPLIILTLGLMLVVINALMLMLTGAIADGVGLGFEVDGFWTAVLGSIVISVVSMVLEAILPDGD